MEIIRIDHYFSEMYSYTPLENDFKSKENYQTALEISSKIREEAKKTIFRKENYLDQKEKIDGLLKQIEKLKGEKLE